MLIIQGIILINSRIIISSDIDFLLHCIKFQVVKTDCIFQVEFQPVHRAQILYLRKNISHLLCRYPGIEFFSIRLEEWIPPKAASLIWAEE